MIKNALLLLDRPIPQDVQRAVSKQFRFYRLLADDSRKCCSIAESANPTGKLAEGSDMISTI